MDIYMEDLLDIFFYPLEIVDGSGCPNYTILIYFACMIVFAQ